jgi:hypothetical protein
MPYTLKDCDDDFIHCFSWFHPVFCSPFHVPLTFILILIFSFFLMFFLSLCVTLHVFSPFYSRSAEIWRKFFGSLGTVYNCELNHTIAVLRMCRSRLDSLAFHNLPKNIGHSATLYSTTNVVSSLKKKWKFCITHHFRGKKMKNYFTDKIVRQLK